MTSFKNTKKSAFSLALIFFCITINKNSVQLTPQFRQQKLNHQLWSYISSALNFHQFFMLLYKTII